MTSIAQRCREAGIDTKTYYNRLKRGETDLFRPTKYARPTEELSKTLKENGITYNRYRKRLSLGWSHIEACNIPVNGDRYLYYNGVAVHSLVNRNIYNYYYKLYNYEGEEKANKYLERKLNEQRV